MCDVVWVACLGRVLLGEYIYIYWGVYFVVVIVCVCALFWFCMFCVFVCLVVLEGVCLLCVYV